MRCDNGKRRYQTLEDGEQVIAQYIKQWGEDDPMVENLNVYKCAYCKYYHVGHQGGKTPEQKLLEDIRRIRRSNI